MTVKSLSARLIRIAPPALAKFALTFALRLALALALMFITMLAPAVWRPAFAVYDIDFDHIPTGAEFDSLTNELGVALAPMTLAPASPLGTLHFDGSLLVAATAIDDNAPYWKNAFGRNNVFRYFVVPRASLRAGLPKGIDIGANVTSISGSNIKLTGGEVKWTFLGAGTVSNIAAKVVVPSMAVRLSHEILSGVDQLDFNQTAVDVSISKGFPIVTPYGGAGVLRSSARVHGLGGGQSGAVSSTQASGRYFVGVRLSALWFKTTLEAQRAGGLNSYAVRLGFVLP